MQQKLAEKEKASKEENLRMLAQRAREGRTGMPPAAKPSTAANAAFKSSLGAYGSGSEDESEESEKEEPEDSGDDEAARVRDQMRKDKRQEREREMRMSHMGTEQRMKQIARSVFHVLTTL
jgi:SNW domain-containing protein 1